MTTQALHPSAASSAVSIRRPRRSLRSIGAIAAGLATIFAVTTATDLALVSTGVFPPFGTQPPMSDALFLLAFAYRLAFGVAGCYLTARLAPHHPMRHALVLGSIGLVLSIGGAIALWNSGPAWYPLGVIASILPGAWLGGRLQRGLTERSAASREGAR